MKSNDFEGMNCPIAKVMSALNDRWGVLIMRDVLLGLRRYDELKSSTNITHATLSDRLKVLEKNQLIEKRRYQDKPPRYEYWPTPKGLNIGQVILMMLQVGNQLDQQQQIPTQLIAVEKETLEPIHLLPVEQQSAQILQFDQITIVASPEADQQTLWRLAQAKKHQHAER